MYLVRPLMSGIPRNTPIIIGVWSSMFLVFWTFQAGGVIPNPLVVAKSFLSLFAGAKIIPDLVASLTLNVEATLISTGISLLISYLFVLPAFRPVSLLISKLRYLGLSGLTFLLGLIVSGHELKLGLLVFGMSTFFVTSMVSVISDISTDSWRHARSLRMSPWRATLEVVVFGTFDSALEILRQNSAVGWIMLTTVEILSQSEGGIGVVLRNANRGFRMDDIFAVQILILLIGLGQDALLGFLKRALCPYSTR